MLMQAGTNPDAAAGHGDVALARRETLLQFLRFGLIGSAGFLIDSSVLYAAIHFLGLGYYSGRVVSWLSAATFTWGMNRRFTFKDKRPPLKQWLAFLAAQSVGGLVNYGVYAALVATVPLVKTYYILGVGAGSIVGLTFNFSSSKWLVFRARKQARGGAPLHERVG
jgi:putative flippase GtrA